MRIVFIALLIILCNSGFNGLRYLPQDIGQDVPQGKLNSLSYAPYRDGQSPFDETFPSVEQIDEDLALLADKTFSIRTYASAEGTMPAIPALAEKHGLSLIQGAWLSAKTEKNQQEVDALVDAASRYPTVVKRLIVGNEVLLRKDLTVDELIAQIRHVKKQVKQPLSYADVWSIYMQYPQLISEVDFVTIHILPYWEDDPVSIDQAAAHVVKIYKKVREKVDSISPNKPILIGESGWPSAGRQRGDAVASVVNEARFIRTLIQLAKKNNFDYNIVEAINQGWKAQLEGVVGARWGLLSTDRKEVFALTGAVSENPQWSKNLLAETGLFLLVIGGFWRQVRDLASLHVAVLSFFMIFSQLLSSLLVNEANWLWLTALNEWQPLFSPFQRYYTVIVMIVSSVMAGLLLQRAYSLLSNRATLKIGSALYVCYMLFIAFAFYKTYGLVIDGRYLDFPYPVTAIPAVGMSYLILVRYLTTDRQLTLRVLTFNDLTGSRLSNIEQDKWLGFFMVFMGFALLGSETYAFSQGHDLLLAYPAVKDQIWRAFTLTINNGQLCLWLLSLFILALPLVANGYRRTEQY